MKTFIVGALLLLVSSAYAQKVSMREFFRFENFKPEQVASSDSVLKERNLRDIEKWFSSQKKPRFVYSIDLQSIGIPITLRAQKRIWEEDLGGSGRLILQGNKLRYVYTPQDFGPGSFLDSFKPLLAKVERFFD